jgi:uncharacterized protein (DUF302 family)
VSDRLLTRTSSSTVAETVQRLIEALERRRITVFSRIDHAEGARSVGLELADEVVVIFGNPQAGTPLMQAAPSVGIELPLRMLVWDDHGTTTIAYHDPHALAARYGLEATETLEAMLQLLETLAHEASG